LGVSTRTDPGLKLRLETLRSCAPSDRRVVLVHPDVMAALHLHDDDVVDLVAGDGRDEHRAAGFRVVSYPTAPGAAATYFPPFPRAETGQLVRLVPPLPHQSHESRA
jgi:hypothetical protein